MCTVKFPSSVEHKGLDKGKGALAQADANGTPGLTGPHPVQTPLWTVVSDSEPQFRGWV
jgi:hypothetical protein